MKRLFLFLLCLLFVPIVPGTCEPIRWVSFDVPHESLVYAMNADIESADQEKHISWIDILALAACRTGGKCPVSSVKKAFGDLQSDQDVESLLGELYKYYLMMQLCHISVLGNT